MPCLGKQHYCLHGPIRILPAFHLGNKHVLLYHPNFNKFQGRMTLFLTVTHSLQIQSSRS